MRVGVRGSGVLTFRADQREQALVILAAGRAALEMRAHARHGGVGVHTGELGLHVAVELREALVAGELRPGRAEDEVETVAFGARS